MPQAEERLPSGPLSQIIELGPYTRINPSFQSWLGYYRPTFEQGMLAHGTTPEELAQGSFVCVKAPQPNQKIMINLHDQNQVVPARLKGSSPDYHLLLVDTKTSKFASGHFRPATHLTLVDTDFGNYIGTVPGASLTRPLPPNLDNLEFEIGGGQKVITAIVGPLFKGENMKPSELNRAKTEGVTPNVDLILLWLPKGVVVRKD